MVVTAYYVNLLGHLDDGSAMCANVFDNAIIAIGASYIDYEHYSVAVILLIVCLFLDFDGNLEADCKIIHPGLLG